MLLCFMASHLFPSRYPHKYHNYEGFKFLCGGSTYSEFPIIAGGGRFDEGDEAGPDRVIFECVIFVSFRVNFAHSLPANVVVSAAA